MLERGRLRPAPAALGLAGCRDKKQYTLSSIQIHHTGQEESKRERTLGVVLAHILCTTCPETKPTRHQTRDGRKPRRPTYFNKPSKVGNLPNLERSNGSAPSSRRDAHSLESLDPSRTRKSPERARLLAHLEETRHHPHLPRCAGPRIASRVLVRSCPSMSCPVNS